MSGYAAFAAAHRERLVRALEAETGLSRARAQALARKVLAAAWERGVTFPDGAAYGWLRVAARHLVADPKSAWADAADTAVAQAHDAAAALAELAPSERELIRLRYAEGLLPGAIADRLGTTAADVRDRLERATTGAARRIGRRRIGPYLRPVTSAILIGAAAATLVVSTAHTGSPLPPWASGLPGGGAPSWLEPVDATTHLGPGAGALALQPVAYVTDIDANDQLGRPAGPRRRPCTIARGCFSKNTVKPDEVVVVLPDEVGDATGTSQIVVKQEYLPVSVCSAVPAPPTDVAYCVPGHA